MTSERIQRRIGAFLDQAEAASDIGDWATVAEKARAALAMDAESVDASALLRAAEANLGAPAAAAPSTPNPVSAPAAVPESFVAGRYHVRKFLGEGGKKRVFLAHDALLDRDIAFALIKTEGLDDIGRERITREAQAMGRMGAHPHVVSIYDIGEEGGAPYVVTELLGGGDVEGELAKAEGPLDLARTLEIAKGVARGLVFAHAQGIVHRDLKPGNVWLTADGVAKIGDFGLAVNLGRSRLTQHGLMVGTFHYMPPEQALGGEVTPQSDLYSLGAMLYELVTGRPPFAGDDATAVISQHLSATPVAPSWTSAHCPPDLEALILNLLAKVPADRPASAAEVLAALEAVDPDVASASHSDSSANPLDRLARGVFVGRELELERLRAAFDEAFAGRGNVVMLVGEPGIGKTRAAQEAETYARMRGAQVLWGRAHEAEGAPPYFPWVQIARAYRVLNADEVRRQEYGPYAVELQRLLPALRDLFPNLPEPRDAESAEGQFRLFDAMSGFLRDVSQRVPLVVVLDDLHWADRPTLLMLAHVAREIGHARVLLLGTYRDTDLARTHPLSQALADLNREQLFTRIPLRGLERDEVGAYIRGVAHIEPSAALVARIHEETEGNPFFVSEVVNLLTQEGTLTSGMNTSISDLAIPAGVKEALGRRLDRLSPEANELLTLAAVAGREFEHALLVALRAGQRGDTPPAAQDDDVVLRLVEEALGARVIEETGRVGSYRFTHALMQETLAGELSAARQVRLHGQIADTLDKLYGTRAEANAPELARHYAESAVLNRAHARQAVRYLRLAAEQATAQYAWGEAVRQYERCLAVITEATEPLDEGDAALQAALSRCAGRAREFRTHWRAGRAALERYRERSDWVAFAHVVVDINPQYVPTAPLHALIEEARAGLGTDGDLPLRAELAIADLRTARTVLDPAEAEAIREEAVRLVEDANDPLLHARLVAWSLPTDFGPEEFEEAAAVLAARGEQGSLQALNVAAVGWAMRGAIDRAAAGFADVIARCHVYGESPAGYLGLPALLIERGEYDAARAILEEHRDSPSRIVRAAFLRLAELAGDFDEALSWMTDPAPYRGLLNMLGNVEATRARALWRSGRIEEAREAAARVDEALLVGHDTAPALVAAMAALDDAGPLLASERLSGLMRGPLPPWPGLVGINGGTGVLWGRLRGDWALHFDDLDLAEQCYAEALEVARRERLPVEEGRTRFGLANLAERRGDIEAAHEHLDAAGEIFARHGAKVYLDQVIAKKQVLRA